MIALIFHMKLSHGLSASLPDYLLMAGHDVFTKLMTLLCPPLRQRASHHTARASHLELKHKVKKKNHHSFEPSLHIEPPCWMHRHTATASMGRSAYLAFLAD